MSDFKPRVTLSLWLFISNLDAFIGTKFASAVLELGQTFDKSSESVECDIAPNSFCSVALTKPCNYQFLHFRAKTEFL